MINTITIPEIQEDINNKTVTPVSPVDSAENALKEEDLQMTKEKIHGEQEDQLSIQKDKLDIFDEV